MQRLYPTTKRGTFGFATALAGFLSVQTSTKPRTINYKQKAINRRNRKAKNAQARHMGKVA